VKIAVTGSHGLIARHLIPALSEKGHTVVAVIRGSASAPAISWDPEAGRLDSGGLAGVDVVVHLAGVGIAARRWNPEHKRAVLESRVKGTVLIAEAIAGLDPPPKVLVSSSAIGYYGDRGDERLTEQSQAGSGFLADLCRRWEAATAPAIDAGVRVVLARTGVVQSADGGALAAQLPIFKLGLGARFGRGRQWVSWISVADEVGAIVHTIDNAGISGPVNLVAPNPVTNAGYTAILARVLGRPGFLAVPPPAVKLLLGREMATELILGGQRVEPGVLERTGFRFTQPELEPALRAALGR
jgi:uncharacterized protein (TIGR01777 family)